MTGFEPGLRLNAGFHADVVARLLRDHPHSAALLGRGSDVLGHDTARSTDHGWGPRLQVFLAPEDVAPARRAVDAGLPGTYRGRPVRWADDAGGARHHVEVTTLSRWLVGYLGVDPAEELDDLTWLCLPQQRLLGVVSGCVYADHDGALAAARRLLRWYPDQVWRLVLACQWQRLAEEEPFVARTAEVGDDLGSTVLAARLVRDVVRAAFLIERRYAPYAKWLGTAFAALPVARDLAGPLRAAVAARDVGAREDALVAAYGILAARHNAVLPDASADPAPRRFHSRPFRVLGAERFAEACLHGVTDPTLRSLFPIGAVDQHADSTAVLDDARTVAATRAFYRALIPAGPTRTRGAP